MIWHVAPPAAKDHSKEGLTFRRGVEFDGRTITVPYKSSRSGALIQATGPDGERYDLRMMRVHTPSEHTFDGQALPLEVQVINALGPVTESCPTPKCIYCCPYHERVLT